LQVPAKFINTFGAHGPALSFWPDVLGNMALPPLHKYLRVDGAKKTLGTNTFRHAKPSSFNDIEDLTIASIFPEGEEAALAIISANFVDVILANLNTPPTCLNAQMRAKVAQIQQIFRANPNAAAIVKAEMLKNPDAAMLNLESLRALSTSTLAWINEFMQRYRVLCVTTHNDSEQMWSGYAENHKGIALRIEGNVDKDSKFQLFKPVTYREKRPSLYDGGLNYLSSSLFADQETSKRAMMDKIIYSKTRQWEHESEYRLAIPLGQGEQPYETLKFHAEEITELYLGLAMDDADKADILAKAQALNPDIAVFQAKRDAHGTLAFDRAT
jgi:hypothetical protein